MVEPTPVKNISQNGNLPQIGVKITNIGNHHLGPRQPYSIHTLSDLRGQAGAATTTGALVMVPSMILQKKTRRKSKQTIDFNKKGTYLSKLSLFPS